jgi:hypothetical protein
LLETDGGDTFFEENTTVVKLTKEEMLYIPWGVWVQLLSLEKVKKGEEVMTFHTCLFWPILTKTPIPNNTGEEVCKAIMKVNDERFKKKKKDAVHWQDCKQFFDAFALLDTIKNGS